jgi:hypothetical protein
MPASYSSPTDSLVRSQYDRIFDAGVLHDSGVGFPRLDQDDRVADVAPDEGIFSGCNHAHCAFHVSNS